MYLGFDRWHPVSSAGYWWKQINFIEHLYRCCSSETFEWPEPHYYPSPGTNIDDVLLFFFNVIFINGFPSIHVNLHIRPQCRNLVWDVLTSYFPYTQAAMSKKKDHSTLWTIEVDDAVDDMNDLLREAENLDEQVCLQPVHRGLVACDILMLANNIHCIRVTWKKVRIMFYFSTFHFTEALN